ncbi:MAG: DNA polymerase Y family protein [Alteraurantiacibacter sp.]
MALFLPFLPANRLRLQEPDRFTRTADSPPDAPLVFVAKVRGALRLAAVDAQAQAQGIAPGQTLADARALQPNLIVAEMDEAADRHWLALLARRCHKWSPRVAVTPPDGITIDIAGCAHLCGGEAGLASAVEDDFAAIGMELRHAAASTPEAARALVRYGGQASDDERSAIRALPIAALELDDDATLALRRAGLKRIGDVAARPTASIAARFGAGAITALRRLTGEEDAPMAPLLQPAVLHFQRRFAEPITHQTAIAHCFADLLREAAEVLAQRDLGGRRFALTLARSDGARHRLDIETGQPTRDPALVLRLFDERIAALADPLDPGFGYDSIDLFLPVTQPLGASQPAFGGDEQTTAQLAELIDRLSTRLGRGSLRRLVPGDSHIPEQAQLALPATEYREPIRWPAPPPGEPPMRPLFLFDPPQPVEVIAEVPDGPPHRFRWRRNLHEVRLFEGPERIAGEWWRRKGGEHPGKGGLTRDYYRVEDVRGRRFWIFRHGLYEEKPDPRQGPKWYLHGLFA